MIYTFLGDGATRSRIEDGWHPNWERARRKEKGRRMKIREHSGILSMSQAMQKKSLREREQEEKKREEERGFENIVDFNITSNAEEKFAGATLSSAEDFELDMTLGEEERRA